MTKIAKLLSTKQLAEILGVSDRTVRNTTEKLRNVLSAVSRNSQGGYLFTEEQATIIKKEIQKHHNLSSRQIDDAKTEVEVLQNFYNSTMEYVSFLQQQQLKLEEKIAQDAPKVEFYDDFMDFGANVSLRDAAKEINVKESMFIAYLLDHHFIYRQGGKIRPYSPWFRPPYQYFVLKDYVTDRHSGQQTLVTPEGREYFKGILTGPLQYLEKKPEGGTVGSCIFKAE